MNRAAHDSFWTPPDEGCCSGTHLAARSVTEVLDFRWNPASGELDLFADMRVSVRFQVLRQARGWSLATDIDVIDAECRQIEVCRDRRRVFQLEPWATPCERLAQDFLHDARQGDNGLLGDLTECLTDKLNATKTDLIGDEF